MRTMVKDTAAMPMKMASMMIGTIDGEKRMSPKKKKNVHKARFENGHGSAIGHPIYINHKQKPSILIPIQRRSFLISVRQTI